MALQHHLLSEGLFAIGTLETELFVVRFQVKQEPLMRRITLQALGTLEFAVFLWDMQQHMVGEMSFRCESLVTIWAGVLVRVLMQSDVFHKHVSSFECLLAALDVAIRVTVH